MKNFKLFIFALFATIAFVSCEEEISAPGTNYISFQATDYTFEVTPDGSTTQDIYVYTANVTSSDRTFEVTVESSADASIYSIPTSVTIPGGTNKGVLTITGNDVGLDFVAPETVVLGITPVEGLSVGQKMTLNFVKQCIYNKLFISITFDDYPEEVYWSITNSAGDTVAESATPAAFGAYADMTGSFTQILCMESGNYTFNVYDGWGDGAGPVKVTTADGTVLFETDGDYGEGTSGDFTL